LLNIANKSVGNINVLDAGRSNPIFFASMPREAFSLLTKICMKLVDNFYQNINIGIIPQIKGIEKKFKKILYKSRNHSKGKFLKDACNKMHNISGIEKDEFYHNLVTSTIGCSYPCPPRVQKFVEPVLIEFLNKKVYYSKKPLKGKVKIMPTEGSASAILYVLNSLKYNGIVIPGDKIGIITPIFSPYLEIPELLKYDLNKICIRCDENNNWEIPQYELEKIGDSTMRALLLVNPSNPTGMSLTASTVSKIANIVHNKNPNIIILEDSTYSPFTQEFNCFFNSLPRNTIGIFSFSKYFGATGWRLGTIIMHNNNIIDSRLINSKFRKDTENLEKTNKRYAIISKKPENIKFIDRILADSREVAEAHLAGLSTPQQTIMALFAIYDILDKKQLYKNTLNNMLLTNKNNLLSPIKYNIENNNLNSNYYIVIDITKTADGLMGGTNFGKYMLENRDPLEFLSRLAKSYGTVLLPTVGFAGPFWGVRVSLVNLDIPQYEQIGQNILSLIDEYYEDFKKWEKKRLRKQELEMIKKIK